MTEHDPSGVTLVLNHRGTIINVNNVVYSEETNTMYDPDEPDIFVEYTDGSEEVFHSARIVGVE